MKSVSAALAAHLAGPVTTLATCWRITRVDGQEFFFTDHDRDLVFEGHVYKARSGYSRTAIANDASLGVDNLDVEGVFDSERRPDLVELAERLDNRLLIDGRALFAKGLYGPRRDLGRADHAADFADHGVLDHAGGQAQWARGIAGRAVSDLSRGADPHRPASGRAGDRRRRRHRRRPAP